MTEGKDSSEGAPAEPTESTTVAEAVAAPAPAPAGATGEASTAAPTGTASEATTAVAPAPAGATGEASTAAPEAAAAASPDDDTIEEAIPESMDPKRPQGAVSSHHPPPPPRLRGGAASQPGRRLQVTGDPKLARDLMTRQVFTIGPNDVLQGLEEHMATFRFHHLPVIEGNKVIGVIHHSDLLHACTSSLSAHAERENEVIHKLPAARIMRKDFVTVRPSEPLENVAARLWEDRAGCVLITEEDGTLVGIVAEGDFVRLAHHFLSRGAAPTS